MPALSLPRAILFDLDGTLADTAPDLAGAINQVRVRRELAPTPYEVLRPVASAGARGLIGAAFGLKPDDAGYEELRDEFLDTYASALAERSSLFPGMARTLEGLEQRGLQWGIVTNKATRYAEPVVRGLGLDARAGVLIAGDTTAHAKPHPAPLLEAARRLGRDAGRCVYVGDDLRDVQAGRAAGMATLAAGWGYLGQGEHIDDWGADAVLEEPAQLLNWLRLA